MSFPAGYDVLPFSFARLTGRLLPSCSGPPLPLPVLTGAHVFLLSRLRPRLFFACQAGYVCLMARGPDDYAAVLQVHSSAAPASPLRSAAAFGLASARTPALCSRSLAALAGDEHGSALQTMLALSSPCRAAAWGDLLAWAARRWQAEGCRCDPTPEPSWWLFRFNFCCS